MSEDEAVTNIDYSLQKMLNVPEDEVVIIKSITDSTTAVTIKASVENKINASYFIKTSKKRNGLKTGTCLGIREVEFYKFINSINLKTYPNIPKCINKHISDDGQSYYLVLEDLSPTYTGYQKIDAVDLETWRFAVRALAGFHKFFINKLSENQILAKSETEIGVQSYVEKLRTAYSRFKEDHAGQIEKNVFQLLEKSISDLLKIEQDKNARIKDNSITTITHGDSHIRNFLFPENKHDIAKIVDWQFWNIGVGTYDLRHLLGHILDYHIGQHQKSLVGYYFQTLSKNMSLDYSWEECWTDYRKGILDNLFMPVWQYAGFGWEYGRWIETLNSAVENYYELECDNLEL